MWKLYVTYNKNWLLAVQLWQTSKNFLYYLTDNDQITQRYNGLLSDFNKYGNLNNAY